MRKFLISTESTCDLPLEVLNNNKIYSIGMKFSIDDIEYGEENKITNKEFCDKMREGSITKTASVNTYDAQMYFEKLLQQGQDILHIAFTSGMSGSYNNLKHVTDELNKTSTNKIYLIDSLCACSGQGLFCLLAAEKADKEESIQDVLTYLESIKQNIVHLFTVDNLQYLVRGGRVSKTKAQIANALQIKPVLFLNSEGQIQQYKTVISRKKSIMTLCEDTAKKYTGVCDKIIISHADCLEDATLLQTFIKRKLGLDCEIYELSHVICSHSGPGTLSIYFVGDNR